MFNSNWYVGILKDNDPSSPIFSISSTGTLKANSQFVVTAAGNVGIGTITPGAKLEVVGQVKITGGSPGASKVLTSDATGLATWQVLTGGGSGWTGLYAGCRRPNQPRLRRQLRWLSAPAEHVEQLRARRGGGQHRQRLRRWVYGRQDQPDGPAGRRLVAGDRQEAGAAGFPDCGCLRRLGQLR